MNPGSRFLTAALALSLWSVAAVLGSRAALGKPGPLREVRLSNCSFSLPWDWEKAIPTIVVTRGFFVEVITPNKHPGGHYLEAPIPQNLDALAKVRIQWREAYGKVRVHRLPSSAAPPCIRIDWGLAPKQFLPGQPEHGIDLCFFTGKGPTVVSIEDPLDEKIDPQRASQLLQLGRTVIRSLRVR